MPRRASIRAHLLRLVLAVALPLAALDAWNLYATAQADSQHARQQVFHLAQHTASDTAKFLGQAHNILNGLAARPAVRALDPARCDPILKDFLGLAPRFANVVTMSIDGRVVCSAVPIAQPSRGDPDRFLKLMRGSDQLTVGQAAPGVITGRWVVPVGRSLLDAQGGIAGAVVLPVDLLNLPVLPSVAGLSAKAVVWIVAADGTVLAHSPEPKRFVGTNQRDQQVTRIVLREKSGTAEEIGIDGIARVQGFTPVPGTDWIAIAGLPASELYAGVKARIATSALLGMTIVLAVLLLAVRGSHAIVDPIAALADTANEVAAGNLAARAPVAGAAEIAAVATHFNRMLDSRARDEEALRESKARLEALTRRLLEVQETERRSIARELHDEVGGVLIAVKLNLQSLRRNWSDAGGTALADSLALVDGAIQSVRSISLDLRPAVLDDLGLIPALKWYCERQARRAGVAIELALDAVDLKTAPQLESACFRIFQESVTNALRHANARRIQVSLRRSDGSLVLEIADDGAGFEMAAARKRGLAGESSGLVGMEERATLLGGRLELDSAPGAGTCVRATFSMPEGGFA